MSKVQNVSSEELISIVSESNQPVFIDFYADWCGPCKMVMPVIEQLADTYQEQMKVVKVNVDLHKESASKYGVRSIPTFVVLKNNEVVMRHSGAAPKSFFDEKIKNILK